MSTVHSMQTSMQFGPEWMRKPAKPHGPSPPPAAAPPAAGASSYSALVSPAPPPPAEKRDETHPFRYSREEMLKIYRDGGGKGGLGLEVERYEGIVRETASDPVGMREMSESEKKVRDRGYYPLFAGSLNSELRRRQSIDYLSPLSIQTTGERPRLPHNTSSGTGSPLRERFGGLGMRRRESSGECSSSIENTRIKRIEDQLSALPPRKLSLSSTQGPMSPRDTALPSPRTRLGHTPTFDGVLNGGESWVARRRASEAKAVARDADHHEGPNLEIREEDEDTNANANADSGGDAAPQEIPQAAVTASPPRDPPAASSQKPATEQLIKTDQMLLRLSFRMVPHLASEILLVYSGRTWIPRDSCKVSPFRADLMQKWFDDGYFTADLLMKRTHIDVDWVAVGELVEIARRSGSDKLFLAPPVPPGPPGLSRSADQSFPTPVEQNAFNSPLQPAPVRTLRSSTLDYAGSSHSDSPSSSFGAGRFGNGSPDSHGFGGRANNQYSTDPAVGGRFGVASDSSSALRRNTFGDEPVYGVNGSYSPSQGPWQASSSNPLAPSFDALNGGFGSSSNLTGLGQGNSFSHIRAQESAFGDAAPANFQDFMGSQQLGGAPFGPGQQYTHLPYTPPQPVAATPSLFGQPAKPTLPQPVAQSSGLPAAPTQSPWGTIPESSAVRRAAPFDTGRPATNNNGPTTPIQTSPWGAATQTNEPPTHWFAASHGVIEEHWQEERGHSLTFSNVGQHNQQFTSVPDDGPKAPAVATETVQLPPETSEPEVPATVKPAATPATPPQPVKARTKSNAQQPIAQAPITPVIPAAESTPAVAPVPPKAAWSKEEEAKRPKPSGVTLSLRDIQEAEAKKAEARKVAERDRAAAARASSSTAPSPEEAQPFTASWGLPTSQAGARAAPAKEPIAATSPTGGATGGSTAVWTNATKTAAAKKTMKEIQEEEEKRKKMATKETAAQAARRAYAESTTKAPPPQPAPGAAWTTVGAPKASNPAPAPVRPPIAPAASSTSTSVPRANGVAAARPAPAPAKAPTPRVEDYPATASHEFVRWLSDSLKGLNNSVNVEEIMSMLLSFPLDPDQSTVELISDLIYANSTTLDGRRFAAEFVSKRKADAASRPKGAAVSGAGAGKSISIADVVKAQPKPPAANEWGGFKVVNKKKKGGRSMHLPVIHHRRQVDDPLTNIFGTTTAATETTPATTVPTTTAATTTADDPLSDPLGGLTSALGSILSPIIPTTTSSSVVPSTTPSTTSTTPTTTTPTTTSTPTTPPVSTLPPTTVNVDVTSTTTPLGAQTSGTIPSSSSSASATPAATNHSAIAIGIGCTLVGLFALGLLISFFLRRWNRNRSRMQSRESINFNPDEFRQSAAVLKDDHSARFTEQKGYPESALRVPAMAPAGPGGYADARPYSTYSAYQQPQQMYAAPAPTSMYVPQQQQPQIYSPNPHHAYPTAAPTAAQQVAEAYRGGEDTDHMPNPHPVTHPDGEDAYGGI
ncbi:GYF domain-containing protein [Mycena sanguinolenta]|uniref:GYF domain-containing protein n=1 Tax=Mycena sanguinolenta TaxID=230812 RepID=A0A8H6YVS2_9AGAR|nr:GYF domain-containing protein [Mycena sanguinolenta]